MVDAFIITVDAQTQGQRIDKLISEFSGELTRSAVQKILSDGMAMIMGGSGRLEAGLSLAPGAMKAFKAVGGHWGKGRELPDIVSSKPLKKMEGKNHEQ